MEELDQIDKSPQDKIFMMANSIKGKHEEMEVLVKEIQKMKDAGVKSTISTDTIIRQYIHTGDREVTTAVVEDAGGMTDGTY